MVETIDNEDAKALVLIDGGKADDADDADAAPERAKGPGKPRRLTAKQMAFADGIIAGLHQSAAYKAAYDTDKMLGTSIHCEASKLMLHPHIAQRISTGMVRNEREQSLSAANVRGAIAKRLSEIAGLTNVDGPHLADRDVDRLAAIRMLGQLGSVQAFDTPEGEKLDDLPGDDVMTELERKLKAAFKQ
jgi:hypothetical protein